MNKLDVGDVVQLKSGGPQMTVVEVGESSDVKCMWFPDYKSESVREDHFPIDALKKVQGRSGTQVY